MKQFDHYKIHMNISNHLSLHTLQVTAFELFLEMTQRGLPADPMVFTSLLGVCQRSAQWEQVHLHLYARLQLEISYRDGSLKRP